MQSKEYSMYAAKIQMKPGCRTSNNLQEIDSIYIEGYPFYRFAKKSEALEWERNFKLKENQSISMSFQSFVDIYLTDLELRIKRNTFLTKKHIIETKILPYFGKRKLDDIRTSDVIQWQNEIGSMSRFSTS